VRIAMVDVRYPPEAFLSRKYRALAALGLKIDVLSGSVKRETQIDGVNWIPLRPGLIRRVSRRLRTVACGCNVSRNSASSRSHDAGVENLSYSAYRALKRADVIHFEWVLNAAGHQTWWHHFDAPKTVSLRGSQVKVAPHDPGRVGVADYLRSAISAATLVHCVSEDMRRVASEFGLAADRARIIRPAVDPSEFRPPGVRQADQELALLSVGRLDWKKGIEFALVGIKEALRRGIAVRYTIVGSGRERMRLVYAINELGLQDHVCLAGERGSSEVAQLLQQNDVLLLPSIEEGIANAALEAMSTGLVVVASDVGGMGEVIQNGYNGILTSPRNPIALADALVALVTDRDLMQKIGSRARATVAGGYTLSSQAERWRSFYKEAMTGNSGSSTHEQAIRLDA
jgi:colanic acid/amylovoran biosynthesis glycosyltransferase